MRGAEYVVKRILFAVATTFVAISISFAIFRAAPGNTAELLAHAPNAGPDVRAALEREFGLDKPVWQQYLLFLKALGAGNLGVSYADRRPVIENLATDLENTVPMILLGTVIAIVGGIATGVVSAWRRGTVLDHGTVATSLVFFSLPAQWLGLMLIIVFSGTLPAGGRVDPFLIDPSFLEQTKDVLRHMILPALTFALIQYGQYTLIVRSAMLETLGEDYVLTAKAKGLTNAAVVRKHALRNAMLPTVSLIGLSLGFIVGGSILIESVFSWPGIGGAVYDAVLARDYPMLQGAFLVFTISVILCNLVADLMIFKLDPRVRS